MRAISVVERKIGITELAARLKVPEDTLRAWRDGHATMPERKFLMLIDVLTELVPTWDDWDQRE
jgi:DNA-binding transcriptional regulator YiaG